MHDPREPASEAELKATVVRMEARLRVAASPAARAAYIHYTHLVPRFEADLAGSPRDVALAKASALMLVQQIDQTPEPT